MSTQLTQLSEPPQPIPAQVQNISGSWLHLVLEQSVPLDAPVRIDLENMLFLGEVRYCHGTRDGYAVGIALEHSLTHLDGLQTLMDRLFKDNPRSRSN
jgi:hypothetical protein